MQPAEATDRRVNPSLWDCQAEKQINITMMPTHYGRPEVSQQLLKRCLKLVASFIYAGH